MKVALITGGSRGIGKAASLKLAAMGHHVVINFCSNNEEAEKTLAEIKANNGNGELLQFDVANKDETQKKLGDWIEKNKETPIEILVNNAGIRKDNLMMMMSDEDWTNVIDTNLHSFFYVTRMLLSGMIFKRFGRVINMVSLSGLKGLPGQVNYSASKAGVIGASKALAQEVGRRGVTINCIAPGFIKTEMTEGISEADFKQIIPMQRFGTAEEVAGVVGFLASTEAAYITGQTISVNGGLYM